MDDGFGPLGLPAGDLAEILEGVGERWNCLRRQRLLLTGGTGFIGKWLLGTFLHANRTLGLDARIVLLSRDVAAFRARYPDVTQADEIEWLQGDVRDFELSAGQRCGFAIHGATDVVATASPKDILDTCVRGTARLLSQMNPPTEQARRRVLLLSSGAVYGRIPSDLAAVPEDWAGGPDTLAPASAYGEGKRVGELLGAIAAAASPNLTVSVARCFALVGPHLALDKHFAIGNFIADAVKGGDILIQGDGTPVRSYLYAADLACWLWVLLFAAPSGRAYNVGSSEGLSIAELAHRVNRVLGTSGAIRIARQPETGAPRQHYVPAVDRIAAEQGLVPRVGLDEAIRRTARWALQQTARQS